MFRCLKFTPFVFYLFHVGGFKHKNLNIMKKARLILGMILLPVFAVIYFIDRALLLIMPWIEQSNIKKWFSGTKEMTASFIRVLTLLICYGVYSLINWLI